MEKIKERIAKVHRGYNPKREAKSKGTPDRPAGVHLTLRVPPLLLEGALAHMHQNGIDSVSGALIDLMQEGLVVVSSK